MRVGPHSKLVLLLVAILVTAACTRAQTQKIEPQPAATSAPAAQPAQGQNPTSGPPAAGTNPSGGSAATQSGSTPPTGPVGGDDLSKVSKLPDGACELPVSALNRIAPSAKLETAPLGARAHEENNHAIEFQRPFNLSLGWGRLLICRWASGNSSTSARLEVGVADFAPVLYDAPGTERAHAAVAKLRARFQPDQMGAAQPVGAPQEVSGLGEEAFRAAWEEGRANAVIGRKGEVLIWLIGYQPEPGVGPAMTEAMIASARDLLARAASAVGTNTVQTATPTSKESLVTQGAVNAVWIVVQDVAATRECLDAGNISAVEIPLATADATAAGYLKATRDGNEEKVFLSTGRLEPHGLVGKGGFRLTFDKSDGKPVRAHFSIDTTLATQEGGSSTSIKGELAFACP